MRLMYKFNKEDLFSIICSHSLVSELFMVLCCMTFIFTTNSPHSYFFYHFSGLWSTFWSLSVWSLFFQNSLLFCHSPSWPNFEQPTILQLLLIPKGSLKKSQPPTISIQHLLFHPASRPGERLVSCDISFPHSCLHSTKMLHQRLIWTNCLKFNSCTSINPPFSWFVHWTGIKARFVRRSTRNIILARLHLKCFISHILLSF